MDGRRFAGRMGACALAGLLSACGGPEPVTRAESPFPPALERRMAELRGQYTHACEVAYDPSHLINLNAKQHRTARINGSGASEIWSCTPDADGKYHAGFRTSYEEF